MGIVIGGPCGLHCYFQLELKIAHQFKYHGWGIAIDGSADRCIRHNEYVEKDLHIIRHNVDL